MNYSSSDRPRLDLLIAEAGRWQHRQVTTAQLRALGLESDDVRYRVRTGRLYPVFAEVYSLGGPPQRDREWWMAATLTFGRGTRLSGPAAAELHGLLRYPLGEIHVTTVGKLPSRDGITTHHRSRRWPWRIVDHIPVTGPEETILDCAAIVRDDRAYRRIVRQAQADALTTHARLLAFAAQNPGRRGVARMKRELAAGPSPTRSANEDEVLEVFRTGGEPLPNHRLAADLELDLYFPKLGIAIEVQSPLHDNPTAQADDLAKKARAEALGVRLLYVT